MAKCGVNFFWGDADGSHTPDFQIIDLTPAIAGWLDEYAEEDCRELQF